MGLSYNDRRLLEEGLARLGIGEPTERATGKKRADEQNRMSGSRVADLLDRFIEELLLWNKRTNLVSTHSTREIIVRHVFDSLSVCRLLKPVNASILDMGSGAGFPSFPLAIVYENALIHAAERRHKRAAFLRNTALILGLGNLMVLEKDVRDIKGAYDIIIARGVGDLSYLYRIGRGLLRENAMIIAFKGKMSEIEKEVSLLKEKTTDKDMHLSVQRVKIPYLEEEERNFVIIQTK